MYRSQAIKSVLVLALVSINLIWAEREVLGSYSGFVERMGGGTRELARGNAAVADIDASALAFWNPALISLKSDVMFAVDGERRQLDRTGGAVSLSSRLGSRMGIGVSALYRGDRNFKVINADDEDLGTAKPTFINTYLGLSWRRSPKEAFGFSFKFSYDNFDLNESLQDENISFNDKHSSAASFNLSWFRTLNPRFDVAIMVRNLGFNKNLTASYSRILSSDNSIPSSEDFYPKALELGMVYHTAIWNKKLDLALQIIDYQLKDKLFAFEADAHVQKARMGMDLEVIPKGNVRLGLDDRTWSLGLGYEFQLKIKKKKLPLAIDYALILERNVYLVNPFSVGLRTRF